MTTDKSPSTAVGAPESRPVTTRSVTPRSGPTSSVQPSTAHIVIRSSRAGALRFIYNTNDAAKQRANVAFNQGPAKVSTEK